MRISDWSSDVCSSDLERASGQTGIFKPMPGCKRTTSLRTGQHGQGEQWQPANEEKPGIPLAAPGRDKHDQQQQRPAPHQYWIDQRSEEHTYGIKSLMSTSYAACCWKNTNTR